MTKQLGLIICGINLLIAAAVPSFADSNFPKPQYAKVLPPTKKTLSPEFLKMVQSNGDSYCKTMNQDFKNAPIVESQKVLAEKESQLATALCDLNNIFFGYREVTDANEHALMGYYGIINAMQGGAKAANPGPIQRLFRQEIIRMTSDFDRMVGFGLIPLFDDGQLDQNQLIKIHQSLSQYPIQFNNWVRNQ
jgi:hypothetical protein